MYRAKKLNLPPEQEYVRVILAQPSVVKNKPKRTKKLGFMEKIFEKQHWRKILGKEGYSPYASII